MGQAPSRTREATAGEVRFVADVMLGRLARWLRALGYDTLYFHDAPDGRLLGTALREGRRLLTRDLGLARRAADVGLLIASDDLDAQIRQVMTACGLLARAPLRRCLVCNGRLAASAPDAVQDRVPAYTFATQHTFWTCTGCGRVFWRGTHAAAILERLRPYLDGPASLPALAHGEPDHSPPGR